MEHESNARREPVCGTITAIAAQRRKGRVNVYIDGEFAFGLSNVVAVRAGLRPGLVLSHDDVARLSDDDAAHVALDAALDYLAHRPRSARELRQNLLRKGLPEDLIDKVVARLAEMSLVDDAAFAQFWVEGRDRFNPRGAYALRSELLAKGVDRDVADEAIGSGDDEETRARTIAERRLRRLHGLDEPTLRLRLVEAVVRRGFSYELANSVVRALVAEHAVETHDLDAEKQ